jgi:hypothetical protein
MPGVFGPERIERLERAVLLSLRLTEAFIEAHISEFGHLYEPHATTVWDLRESAKSLIVEIEEGAK